MTSRGCMIFRNGIDPFFRKHFHVERNRAFAVYPRARHASYWALESDFLGLASNNGDVSGFSLGLQ